MKFSVLTGIHSKNCKSRVGKICDLQRLPNLEFETPLLLLRTKAGSVTHLTREVLQKVTKNIEALQIPLANSAKCYDGVKGYNGNISEFVGLKEYMSYCTTHDPLVSIPNGYSSKSWISIWTVNGRKELNSDRFMDMIEAYRPDLYEVMSDSSNDMNSTVKRLTKSVDNSKVFLTNCLIRHKNSKVLEGTAALAVVEGGYNLELRECFIQHLNQHKDSLDGFVISGLHSSGPEVESMSLQNVAPIISHTLKLLPENKMRIVHGCWHPAVVAGLVDMGIDVFDSTLIDVVTDRYSAFIFHWEAVQRSFESDVPTNFDRIEQGDNHETDNSCKLEICLQDKEYFDDFSPILEGCACLTCGNHTRAYIHHLYTTKELLGPVLLMVHNLHHYLEFFSFIRKTIRKGLSVNITK